MLDGRHDPTHIKLGDECEVHQIVLFNLFHLLWVALINEKSTRIAIVLNYLTICVLKEGEIGLLGRLTTNPKFVTTLFLN